MKADSPTHAIAIIDKAFHKADLDTLLSVYDEAAVLVDYVGVAGGREFRGKAALRELYAGLLKPGAQSVSQVKTHVVEADGIALFTSRWSLTPKGGETTSYIATVVFRRQPDGGWLNLIDTGPAVLDR